MSSDLTERLAEAAAAAVRRRRGSLEASDVRNLTGLTVQLEIRNGAVSATDSYLSWRDVVREARSAR